MSRELVGPRGRTYWGCHVVNSLLNTYAYVHRFVLLLALVGEASY